MSTGFDYDMKEFCEYVKNSKIFSYTEAVGRYERRKQTPPSDAESSRGRRPVAALVNQHVTIHGQPLSHVIYHECNTHDRFY